MLGNLPVLVLAAAAAVQAGPVAKRQETASSIASVVSSDIASVLSSGTGAASSAAMSATSAVMSATSAASSAATSAASAASSSASSVASGASSSASSVASGASSTVAGATATGMNTTTGNQSFPLYPCPAGYLLTYVSQNMTVPMNVTEVTNAFGAWATSSYFPNITANDIMGGNGSNVGATHTLNLQGVDLMETLVNQTFNMTSGYAAYTWNLTNGPVQAMGVGISNYSTVLSIYSPSFTTTQMIGPNTTLLTYTNFCATSQAEGMTLVNALATLELGTFVASLGGMAGTSVAAPMASTAASSAAMMTSSAAGMATSMASSAATMASSMASDATMMASSAASELSSAATMGTAAVASVATSLVSAASSMA